MDKPNKKHNNPDTLINEREAAMPRPPATITTPTATTNSDKEVNVHNNNNNNNNNAMHVSKPKMTSTSTKNNAVTPAGSSSAGSGGPHPASTTPPKLTQPASHSQSPSHASTTNPAAAAAIAAARQAHAAMDAAAAGNTKGRDGEGAPQEAPPGQHERVPFTPSEASFEAFESIHLNNLVYKGVQYPSKRAVVIAREALAAAQKYYDLFFQWSPEHHRRAQAKGETASEADAKGELPSQPSVEDEAEDGPITAKPIDSPFHTFYPPVLSHRHRQEIIKRILNGKEARPFEEWKWKPIRTAVTLARTDDDEGEDDADRERGSSSSSRSYTSSGSGSSSRSSNNGDADKKAEEENDLVVVADADAAAADRQHLSRPEERSEVPFPPSAALVGAAVDDANANARTPTSTTSANASGAGGHHSHHGRLHRHSSSGGGSAIFQSPSSNSNSIHNNAVALQELRPNPSLDDIHRTAALTSGSPTSAHPHTHLLTTPSTTSTTAGGMGVHGNNLPVMSPIAARSPVLPTSELVMAAAAAAVTSGASMGAGPTTPFTTTNVNHLHSAVHLGHPSAVSPPPMLTPAASAATLAMGASTSSAGSYAASAPATSDTKLSNLSSSEEASRKLTVQKAAQDAAVVGDVYKQLLLKKTQPVAGGAAAPLTKTATGTTNTPTITNNNNNNNNNTLVQNATWSPTTRVDTVNSCPLSYPAHDADPAAEEDSTAIMSSMFTAEDATPHPTSKSSHSHHRHHSPQDNNSNNSNNNNVGSSESDNVADELLFSEDLQRSMYVIPPSIQGPEYFSTSNVDAMQTGNNTTNNNNNNNNGNSATHRGASSSRYRFSVARGSTVATPLSGAGGAAGHHHLHTLHPSSHPSSQSSERVKTDVVEEGEEREGGQRTEPSPQAVPPSAATTTTTTTATTTTTEEAKENDKGAALYRHSTTPSGSRRDLAQAPKQPQQEEEGPVNLAEDGVKTILIVMMGLPARGKTFLAQKICRLLGWQGVRAKVLNLQTAWRQVLLEYKSREAAQLQRHAHHGGDGSSAHPHQHHHHHHHQASLPHEQHPEGEAKETRDSTSVSPPPPPPPVLDYLTADDFRELLHAPASIHRQLYRTILNYFAEDARIFFQHRGGEVLILNDDFVTSELREEMEAYFGGIATQCIYMEVLRDEDKNTLFNACKVQDPMEYPQHRPQKETEKSEKGREHEEEEEKEKKGEDGEGAEGVAEEAPQPAQGEAKKGLHHRHHPHPHASKSRPSTPPPEGTQTSPPPPTKTPFSLENAKKDFAERLRILQEAYEPLSEVQLERVPAPRTSPSPPSPEAANRAPEHPCSAEAQAEAAPTTASTTTIKSYIKVRNSQEVEVYNVQGFIASRVVAFVMNLSQVKIQHPIYFVRHGESAYNLEDRIGGNPLLTAQGMRDAAALLEFLDSLKKNIEQQQKKGEKAEKAAAAATTATAPAPAAAVASVDSGSASPPPPTPPIGTGPPSAAPSPAHTPTEASAAGRGCSLRPSSDPVDSIEEEVRNALYDDSKTIQTALKDHIGSPVTPTDNNTTQQQEQQTSNNKITSSSEGQPVHHDPLDFPTIPPSSEKTTTTKKTAPREEEEDEKTGSTTNTTTTPPTYVYNNDHTTHYNLEIWTSQLRRAIQTAELSERLLYIKTLRWSSLNEIYAGVCEDLTYQELATTYPLVHYFRQQNKYAFRYPEGESYQDLVARLEPVIMELENADKTVVVVAHQAVLRCLLAYFKSTSAESCVEEQVPHRTVWRCQYDAKGLVHLDELRLDNEEAGF